MNKYEFKYGAILIQPDERSPTVHLFHPDCRPDTKDGYILVDENPEVEIDHFGKPIVQKCPECGYDIKVQPRRV